MKHILIALALLLFASPAFAQNPTTPVTGGAIVSTSNPLPVTIISGGGGACGSIVANSFCGNFTNATAAAIGNAIPVCTSGQSLQYTAGSGFSCVTQVVFLGVTGTITVGYSYSTATTPLAPTNGSSTTLACATGNVQAVTNNVSAFTLVAPTSDCTMTLVITNGASAGTITMSGFNSANTNHGDAFDATNAHIFFTSIVCGGGSGGTGCSWFTKAGQ